MPRKKEISEDIKSRVVELHKSGKGYKLISKTLGIHQSTVRQILYKWREHGTVATLPRSGRPAKMTPKARRRILNEVKKNPGITAKGLKESLEVANISVSESTIRKTLNRQGFYCLTLQRELCLAQKNTAACLQDAKEEPDASQQD